MQIERQTFEKVTSHMAVTFALWQFVCGYRSKNSADRDGTSYVTDDSDRIEIVPVSPEIIRAAERKIRCCEYCHPESADSTFVHVLDDVTGMAGHEVEYLMPKPAKCPYCRGDVSQTTFVQLQRTA
jgi:hypothetical protein